MVTQREVAEHAGVSLAVVSAVVNATGHTRMSAPTRARVLAAMEELGYRPNLAARAVRLRRTGMIATIVAGLDVPIYTPMLRGIHDAAAARGSAVLLGDAAMMSSGSVLLGRLLAAGTVDGILVRGMHSLAPEVVAALDRRPIPLLSLDVHEDDRPWVSTDDHATGAAATRYLLARGHRRIAFAGGAAVTSTRRRYAGYRDSLEAAGLPVLPHLAPAFGERSGAEALRQVLGLTPQPTAVVINNALGAVGLVAEASDLGVRIPDQLSVVALHDMPLVDHLRPRVTTVRLPMYAFGAAAATALHTLVDGDVPAFGVIDLPAPEVVERDSVAVVPAG